MRVNFVFVLVFYLVVSTVSARTEFNEKQLKKLFTTVQQRNHIDAIRQSRITSLNSTALIKQKKSNRVSVSGFVQSSDGKNTIWINGKNTLKSNSIADIKINARAINKHDQVVLTVNGKKLKLKPGQSWHHTTANDETSVKP